MNERMSNADKKPEIKSQNQVPHIRRKTESYQSMNSPVDRILFLQRTIGNHAVVKLIKSGALQAKLRIGQPGDIYEQEADRVVEQVMATSAHPAASGAPPYIQRLVGRSAGQADAVPASVDHALASPGRPMEPELRQDMEQRFGHDFSRVLMHSGGAAEQSSQEVNAHAYTVGRNIVFGAGEYAPGTEHGRQLLAHELTHVVQQRGAGQGGELTVGKDDDRRHEQEVSTIVREVSGIHAMPSGEARVAPSRLQRDEKRDSKKARQKKLAPPTRLDVVEKQQKVAGLDAEWHPTFRERMESYSAALWRISGSIEIANKGFEAAQQKQAQFEQLIAQIIGGIAGVFFAAGFEWAFSKAAGLLSKNTKKIEKIVETVENPFNAAVSAGININATTTAAKSAERGQAPGIGSTPLAFLSDNFEELHTQAQGIEQAFAKRAAKTTKFSDKQWMEFEIEVQRAIYEKLYEEIVTTASGIEQLKPKEKMAKIFEKLIWAYWLRNLNDMRGAYGAAVRPRPGAPVGDNLPNVGTEIERRLNEIGISAEAGIKLSGHWYRGNSDDWSTRLLEWANTYYDTIRIAEAYVPPPKTKQGEHAA